MNPVWVDGTVFDRYLKGDLLLGTVMQEASGKWFWHRYQPEAVGYVSTRAVARLAVEQGCVL